MPPWNHVEIPQHVLPLAFFTNPISKQQGAVAAMDFDVCDGTLLRNSYEIQRCLKVRSRNITLLERWSIKIILPFDNAVMNPLLSRFTVHFPFQKQRQFKSTLAHWCLIPCNVYMRQRTGSPVVKRMTRCLFDANTFSAPMLNTWQLNP